MIPPLQLPSLQAAAEWFLSSPTWQWASASFSWRSGRARILNAPAFIPCDRCCCGGGGAGRGGEQEGKRKKPPTPVKQPEEESVQVPKKGRALGFDG